MALPTEISRSFRLYVTHVDGEGHFLKISGQLDQPSSLMVESLFETARENLEKGIGAVPPGAIHEGIICAAKYKDGTYYRAKIINTSNLANGLVGVHFIDYGNKDIISLSTIRFLDSYDPMFMQLRGQASDYYLSKVTHPSGRWEEPLLLKLQSLLCYSEYPATIESNTRTLPIISIQFKGNDLSTHLVANRFGIEFPIAKQEQLLMQMSTPENQAPHWQPSFPTLESQSYMEHVPFLINNNFPSNPASAMRLQQNVALPFNGSVPPPSMISQRLMVSKVSRNPISLKAPMRQPQTVPPFPAQTTASPPVTISPNKPPSPKKSTTYKSRLLEVGTKHKVFVSFADEGPELFAVQLVSDGGKLQDMMDDINRRPHSSLAEPPMIGTVCLGRMSGDDRIICRAIVMNLSGSQCKLFFVDFGDTEMVSYYDIFDIPEEFVKPNVFAMRFCLSGVKKLEKGPHVTEAFKQLVMGKVLTLKVVPPEGPPLIQYGELFLDDKNILELLMANMKDKMQFKWMEMLPMGSRTSVLVSYVDSCIKFYVQLSETIDDLNAVMDAVKSHCENTSASGLLPIGSACCARFPEDNNWYRARILNVKDNGKVVVSYVDYGNEHEVDMTDLRTITPDLIKLPAQAMKCALKGYENKPVETKTSNQLEMLALEKTLTAQIVGTLSSDTMLVSLVDETVNPPLDVARRMTQLSTPRSNIETKATTPVRKEAPEAFSSPESEDGKRRSFRREKSFKDERERRPPRDGDELANRAGSFRARENKDGFDRSAPGRHSDKFGGRQDARPERGDRRGSKPWENNAATPVSPPAASDDWEESPASTQPAFQPPPRQNRESRDNNRRRPRPDFQGPRPEHHGPRPDHHGPRPDHHGPRPDHHGPRSEHHGPRPDRPDHHGPRPDHHGPRPGWKSKDSGVGKRLRQAAEAASADAQNTQKFSVQDKLKRGNKFNQQNNDWENRPDRRDSRGDRRDNWGDKKDNYHKRDRAGDLNNRERGDRNRSNFTPRDRAERSFGSDSDKKSDKGFRSNDSEGRAPPYKSRSKFTQVQYKELTEPVPLETPFIEPTVESGAQHEVSFTWIISPESFYTQILSLQPKFLEMMHKIPELYKGVKSYTGPIPVGASVLARYPADGVLYRATVVAIQPFSKFIVRYVDFGNKQLVDAKDIWQLDKQLMDLPKMAVHCSLLGVGPKDGEWKANPEIDLCFNAPRYQCVFQECNEEGQWKVFLWNNGVSVADTLVEKQLAVTTETDSNVALKDEAIDLTIIVEQQILCKVTHVESYDKFYVQLDLDKAALVESAIANFDASKLTPLTMEELAPGVHCTVRHGGRVSRAILQSTDDAQKIQAVLPDYGYSITTQLDNLMILPTELSVYYYQSLECGLNNYTAESETLMTLEQMRERLLNNKLIIYINSVDGIRLISTLYDLVTGEKIAIFTPDEGAYEQVIQLCARAVFNYSFGLGYIAHADTLNSFFIQKAADSDRIARLLDDLFKFYEEDTPEAMTDFQVDGICAAKSADGNWYRAIIVSVEDNDVKVQFSDYGNSETIPKENTKKLDPKFFEPCALALEASLGLVPLQDDALAKLLEWTTDKEVQVTLAFGTDGWLASLHLDGVDLSMKLVNEKLATPQVSSAEEVKAETPVEPVSLPPGCTQVYISHIDTPGHFWLQMSDKVDTIEEIQAELQANANNYPDVENRELGTVCVAKYLADDQWYRAEILDADNDITTVRFIDYGNTDVLDNQPGLIKVLPDNLKETERYAIKSSVNAVPTGTGEWSEPASEYFTQLVGDLSSPVDAIIVLVDITTYVDIYVNGINLTDKLVSEGYATKTEEPECGDMPSCFASHINSPSEFWIQLETATPELQAMESAMVDAENFPELIEKEEGVICAAKYPEDGAWYRAQVIVDGSEGTEVLFMDYGNASIANELRSLPDELKTKAALSRKCALQKPRDIKSWSRKSEVKFNELAAEGATIFNVQFIASGDISIVELYLEGKSVTEELVGLCDESQPVTERPTPVGQDLLTSGKICYVNSLDEFYVQLDDFAPEIDKIIDRLAAAADFEPIGELKVGTVCAGFWDEDEQWYRAKVLEFCDGAHHVLFIDYGNKAKCQEFRQLPEDLALIEPAAKCCRLAGLDNVDLADKAKEKLDEYAAEAATFQIEFLDSIKEPALVRLSIDGKDFCSTISTDGETKAQETEIPPVVADKETTVVESTKETAEQSTKEQIKEVENVVPKAEDVIGETEKVVAETEKVVAEIDKAVAETENVVAETEKVVAETENIVSETEEVVAETENVVAETEKVVAETEKVVSETEKVVSETEKVVAETENIVSETEEVVAETEKAVADTEKTAAKEVDADTNNLATEDKNTEDSELNTSQELNESIDSGKTVIENKSFDSKGDSSNDEFKDAEGSKDPQTPEKDHSSETLENSNDTIKTPERDDSKDSLNTDTGYTSAGDQDKSPIKDETNSPVKIVESDSPKKESVENKDDNTMAAKDEKVDEKVVNTDVKST